MVAAAAAVEAVAARQADCQASLGLCKRALAFLTTLGVPASQRRLLSLADQQVQKRTESLRYRRCWLRVCIQGNYLVRVICRRAVQEAKTAQAELAAHPTQLCDQRSRCLQPGPMYCQDEEEPERCRGVSPPIQLLEGA